MNISLEYAEAVEERVFKQIFEDFTMMNVEAQSSCYQLQNLGEQIKENLDQLEVLALITDTKFSYHLYVFDDQWVQLWAQRIGFENELKKAEEEAVRQKLKAGLVKRREGANLAMQFLSSWNQKKDPFKLDDNIIK